MMTSSITINRYMTRIDHPAFAIRTKFLKGHYSGIYVMPLRTLIRIINQTYTARAIEFKEMGEESTISLVEYTYDSILFRYGL